MVKRIAILGAALVVFGALFDTFSLLTGYAPLGSIQGVLYPMYFTPIGLIAYVIGALLIFAGASKAERQIQIRGAKRNTLALFVGLLVAFAMFFVYLFAVYALATPSGAINDPNMFLPLIFTVVILDGVTTAIVFFAIMRRK